MASVAFKNFLRYPHGRAKAVDEINYEMAKFVLCPKCWLKNIYIYLILIITLVASWFASEHSNIAVAVTIVIFVFVVLTISEITLPRLLPGTRTCQDIPFPPQTGEVINLIRFIGLVFKYTSEESKTKFLRTNSREEGSKIESEDGLSHQKESKNNFLLGETGESLCCRQEFEGENKSKAVLLNPSMLEESHESESDMLHRPLFKDYLLSLLPEEAKATLLSEEETKAVLLPEEETKYVLLSEKESKAVLLTEGESKAALSRLPLPEGKFKTPILSEEESKAPILSDAQSKAPLSEEEPKAPVTEGEYKAPVTEEEFEARLSEGDSEARLSELSEGDSEARVSEGESEAFLSEGESEARLSELSEGESEARLSELSEGESEARLSEGEFEASLLSERESKAALFR